LCESPRTLLSALVWRRRAKSSGCKIQGNKLGFWVLGVKLRVQGLGFRIPRVLRYTPSLIFMDMTPNSEARASCHGGLATAGIPLLSCSVMRMLAMDSTSSSPLSWRSPGQLLVSAAHQCSHMLAEERSSETDVASNVS